MSERQRQEWHKIRKKGWTDKRERDLSVVGLLLVPRPRRCYAPEPLPTHIQHKDTKGNPISLPRVTILERYDEKGNPRCPNT